MALDYLKKILMSGLNVNKKGTLEEELDSLGTSGGGSTDAVQYTPQNLTIEQKTQVYKNIGLPYEGDALHIDIEWNGNTSGRAQLTCLDAEYELRAYKVAEFPEGIDMDALVGGQIGYSDDESLNIDINIIDNYDGMLSIDEGAVFIVPAAGTYDDYYVFPESGIYFWSSEEEYTEWLFVTRPPKVINKIPQSHVQQRDVFMINIDEAYENASLVTDSDLPSPYQTDTVKFIEKVSSFEKILGVDYDIVIRRTNSTQSTKAIFKAAEVYYTYSGQHGSVAFYDYLSDNYGTYSVNKISLSFTANNLYNGQTEMSVSREGYGAIE